MPMLPRNLDVPVRPMVGPDMQITPGKPTPASPPSTLPPSIDPMRQRLAEAILKSTAPQADQPVLHPMQALGNAANQIAGAYVQKKSQAGAPQTQPPAGRSLPAPGTPNIQPRGGPGPAYYSQAKKPLVQPRPLPRPGMRTPNFTR